MKYIWLAILTLVHTEVVLTDQLQCYLGAVRQDSF